MTMTDPNNDRGSLPGVDHGIIDDGAGETEEQDTASNVMDGFEADLLQRAQNAMTSGISYMDSSLRRQLERNLANFRSKHPPGSKYGLDSYRYRSKLFRPKLRATERRHEAALALALFATEDAVIIDAENSGDYASRVAAAIMTELVRYRLKKSIPWFATAMGAYQDAMVMGIVISKQYWQYKEQEAWAPLRYSDGTPVTNENQEPLYKATTKVITDKPVIDIIPRENFIFDAGADWRDPVGTSPYIIHLQPMYVCDLRDHIRDSQAKGGPQAWRAVDDGEIAAARELQFDTIRRAREGQDRQDSKDPETAVSDYDIVWCNENFIKYSDGEEYVFWTLGSGTMLSAPVPIGEVYFTAKRPFVVGTCIIEAHRSNPASVMELGEGIQAATNDITNQRVDNVRLAMNKRFFTRRGAIIDTTALKMSAPGGIVEMDDVQADVKEVTTEDVTASSYREQDRLALDMDEILGNFSSASVQSNRSMNETARGMELVKGDSSDMTEYQLRTFTETWLEPVMRQLVDLEQAYETDATILALAGTQAQVMKKFKKTTVSDDDLQGELVTSIAIGFGATNPQKRMERIVLALSSVAKFLPMEVMNLNPENTVDEIFGALGFKNGRRFFNNLGQTPSQDPQIQKMQQIIMQLQQQLKSRSDVEQMKQQGANERQQMKEATVKLMGQWAQQAKILQLRIEAEANDIKKGELMLQQQALDGNMALQKLNYLLAERDNMAQVLQNGNYGDIPGEAG